MSKENQSEELEKLRELVTELNQRVFRLEQLLEGGASAGYAPEPLPYPTMRLDNLPEPTRPASPVFQSAQAAEAMTTAYAARPQFELATERAVVSRIPVAPPWVGEEAPDTLPGMLRSEAAVSEGPAEEATPPEAPDLAAVALNPAMDTYPANPVVSEEALPKPLAITAMADSMPTLAGWTEPLPPEVASLRPQDIAAVVPSSAVETVPTGSLISQSAPLKPLPIAAATEFVPAPAPSTKPLPPEVSLQPPNAIAAAAPEPVSNSSPPPRPSLSAGARPKPITRETPPESGATAEAESVAASAGPQTSTPVGPVISLESRVGGQWLNRAGIIAMLVALSYFLKLAFDNNWIGPPVRVGIGVAIGIALLLWSERFRWRGFAAFAYSLKAIGIGSLYLSLWAAFQFYHLLPAVVAFGAMVVVTVTSAALSFRQNSELLALFALVGGLLTPLLISSQTNRELQLFGYIALLNLGMLWVVAIKGWPRILLSSFVGTVLLLTGWALAYYAEPQLLLTLGFASGFFVLYAAAPLFVRIAGEGKKSVSILLLAVANAVLYFYACHAMLANHPEELGLLSVAIALIYFVLVPGARHRNALSRVPLAPLYVALAIGFLTIAIPLALDRRWITLGLIIEGGAIICAARYTERSVLRVLGVCALALGVARLILHDSDIDEPLVINGRFGLYLLAIGALALLAYSTLHLEGRRRRLWAGGAIIGMNVLALTALHFEITGYFRPQLSAMAPTGSQQPNILTAFDFTYSAVWMIYSSLLLLIGFWKHSSLVRWQGIILLALTIGKVFFSDIHMLERFYRIAAFLALGLLLLVVSYFYQRNRTKTVA